MYHADVLMLRDQNVTMHNDGSCCSYTTQHNRWSIPHASMPVCIRLPCPDYVQVPWYELLMCPTSVLRI